MINEDDFDMFLPDEKAGETDEYILEPEEEEEIEVVTAVKPVAAPPVVVQQTNNDAEEFDNVFDGFAAVMNGKISNEEKSRLLKVKDLLKINSSDSLWILLMQFERYTSLYDAVPGKIASVVQECVEHLHNETNAQIRKANIDIQRKEREIDQGTDKATNALEDKITNLADKLFVSERAIIEKEVQRRYNLNNWSMLLGVGVAQCLIIMITTSITYSLAKGSSVLPWFELSENSTWVAWIWQAVWNFPSGWVISLLLLFSTGFHFWYNHLKVMK